MTMFGRLAFPAFFRAVYGRDPFPWQTMLLDRVLDSGWPDLLDLPTASGKTACIDIGVFALAVQADLDAIKRTSPRRMFFVVDRRIVVDEAYERAHQLATALRDPKTGILCDVARRLCDLSKSGVPLAVTRLRGGVATDDAWAQLPTQPAIVTSTVDQVGSRMLFRSYGCSPLAAPIHAALVAYDSLIILDEAHCSVPFQQTASAVRDYLDSKRWSEHREPLAPPMRLMIMTATPPAHLQVSRFPAEAERSAALDHDLLRQRCRASKMAALEQVKGKATETADPLVDRAAEAAANFVKKDHCKRVAVMVNRVKTAQAIAQRLRDNFSQQAEIILLTGQMRPIDRDDLINQGSKYLKSGSEIQPGRSILLVTTQCLEVGADFSFDALVTECASLDALLQRFGRLDRLGTLGKTRSLLLTRSEDTKQADDPIYGKALAETWKWLGGDKAEVDFGIDAMVERRKSLVLETLKDLLAPSPDAPVLMPAHVDLLCQTSPRPEPDPDISAYLHGVGRSSADVRVAFRVDLPAEPPHDAQQRGAWVDAIRLCPPATAECLSVSLWKLRRYLSTDKALPYSDDADVEGLEIPEDSEQDDARPSTTSFVIWRGRDSVVASQAHDIRPGDTVVLAVRPGDPIPPELGMAGVGAAIDRAEEAHFEAGRQCVLRVHPDVLASVKDHPAIIAILDLVKQNDGLPATDDLLRMLKAVSDDEPADGENQTVKLPPWLKSLCADLAKIVRRQDLSRHPLHDNALIINARRASDSLRLVYQFDMEDEDDLLSAPPTVNGSAEDAGLSLETHSARVEELAKLFADAVAPGFVNVISQAGRFHDVGKLDERFQCVLNNTVSPAYPPRAKSPWRLPPADARQLRQTLGLPSSFRHEMASLQLLQVSPPDVVVDLPDSDSRDLLRHLVAAHHGYARPFAPICLDDSPPAIEETMVGVRWSIAEGQRREFVPHRVGSGVADRFWRLTRRYGWWGLAYLEAQVRLADWHASEFPVAKKEGRR